jgi:hypothetical protein
MHMAQDEHLQRKGDEKVVRAAGLGKETKGTIICGV